MHTPPASHFLKMAAGIDRGAMKPSMSICVSLHIFCQSIYFPIYLSLYLCICLFIYLLIFLLFHPLTDTEIAGYVTLKHIYEIATIKMKDPCWKHFPMERICKSIIGTAHSCGIEVVKDYDMGWYGEFLEERKRVVEEQKTQLEELKASKLMRVSA